MAKCWRRAERCWQIAAEVGILPRVRGLSLARTTYCL